MGLRGCAAVIALTVSVGALTSCGAQQPGSSSTGGSSTPSSPFTPVDPPANTPADQVKGLPSTPETEAVLKGFRQYYEVLSQAYQNPGQADALLPTVAVDPRLPEIVLEAKREGGSAYANDRPLDPKVVELSGGKATVRDCIGVKGDRIQSDTLLSASAGTWKVSEININDPRNARNACPQDR